MCIDTENSVLYLLGGWNGIHDLADFWAFHCKTGKWECLSIDTERDVCCFECLLTSNCFQFIRKNLWEAQFYSLLSV